jgi:hypothetical protein
MSRPKFKRLQISVTIQQWKYLHELMEKTGESMASVIRNALDVMLKNK